MTPLAKWGAGAGAVVAIIAAGKAIDEVWGSLVFRSHLDAMECRLGHELGQLRLDALNGQLIQLRLDKRRLQGGPGSEMSEDDEADLVVMEIREQGIVTSIVEQSARKNRDCDE